MKPRQELAQPLKGIDLAPSSATVKDRLDAARKAAEPLETRVVTESLLLLLDGSGSMSGRGWRELRQAVKVLVQASDPAHCCLGVAVFSHDADLHAGFTADFGKVYDAIPEMPPCGGTRVRAALKFLADFPWPATRRRAVLFSDGMSTDGNPIPMARTLAELGVVVDTVGCGDADEETLQAIAAATGGRYRYCRSVAELKGVFRALETKARGLLRG